jgi:hypothetical protein
VLIPLVLRPGLALLALSVAADHGVGPVAVAAAFIVLATLDAGATAVAASPRWSRVARWTMGVFAVAAIAIAIAMAVDGIFDV